MKRSKMLERMILDAAGCSNWSLQELMDRVLFLVESEGMLPPENPNLSQEVIDNGLSGNYWEPEE